MAAALDRRTKVLYGVLAPGSPAKRRLDRAVALGIAEIDLALKGEHLGNWYEKPVQAARRLLVKEFPELKKTPEYTLFRAVLAATSYGHNPHDNMAVAVDVWQQYRTSGRMPAIKSNGAKFGRYHQAIAPALQNLQKLVDQEGSVDGAARWLKSYHTVAELRAINSNVGGSAADVQFGGLVIGPKGGRFFGNLVGALEHGTIDEWEARVWNRQMGTMFDSSGSVQKDPRNEGERKLMIEALRQIGEARGLQTAQVQAIRWGREHELYALNGIRSETSDYAGAARDALAKLRDPGGARDAEPGAAGDADAGGLAGGDATGDGPAPVAGFARDLVNRFRRPPAPPPAKAEWIADLERNLGPRRSPAPAGMSAQRLESPPGELFVGRPFPAPEPPPVMAEEYQEQVAAPEAIESNDLREETDDQVASDTGIPPVMVTPQNDYLQRPAGPVPNASGPREPQIKQSRLAAGVAEKATAKRLAEGFEGLPEYEVMNVAEQSRRANDLVEQDPARAARIAMGRELPPAGVLPESVFVAVEQHAIAAGDVNTLRSLAASSTLSLEATGMGQRIRMLAERAPNSPVRAMQQVAEARKAAATRRHGPKVVAKMRIEIKTEINRQHKNPKTWAEWIETIKCR